MSKIEEISAVGSKPAVEAAGQAQKESSVAKEAAPTQEVEPKDKVNLSDAAEREIAENDGFNFKVDPSTIDRSQDGGDTPLNPDGTRNTNPKLQSPNILKDIWEWIKNKYHEIKQKITGFPGEVVPYNGQTVQPLKHYTVNYGYGPRIDPITHQPSFHNGVDLGAMEGMAVRSVKDGKVTRMEYQPDGYGNWVEIQHPDGTYTRYAHLSEFGNVKVGDNIGAGSVIGAVGSTGRSTGPHLHFELRNKDGQPIDPSDLLGIKNPNPGGSNIIAEKKDKELNS
jgi:murein DD-endopeptidase MepM/ murein hydrolase activator NlpD